MIRHSFARRLALGLAALVFCLVCCLPAAAVDNAPYAEDGDLDYIRNYVVTVDLREDGSADITYDIDWQVIDGGKTDYLSWVKIGLANAHVDEMTPLTDTIAELQYSGDGGSYAQVVFAHRYYAPDIAAENGGQSEVSFAFRVHQSHLFTLNDDGTANFVFTPGWFEDLSVENLQIRWRNDEGFTADNTGVDGEYLVWDFGPLTHGQAATVRVTVPVTTASVYDPATAMTAADHAPANNDFDELLRNVIFFTVLLFILVIILILSASRAPRWGGGLGGLDPLDWWWYTNGVHTIRRARGAPPPPGYHRTAAGLPARRRHQPRRRRGPAQWRRPPQQLRVRLRVELRMRLCLCRRRPRRVQRKRLLHRKTAACRTGGPA